MGRQIITTIAPTFLILALLSVVIAHPVVAQSDPSDAETDTAPTQVDEGTPASVEPTVLNVSPVLVDVKATLLTTPPGAALYPSGTRLDPKTQPNDRGPAMDGVPVGGIVDTTPSPVGAPLFGFVSLTVIGGPPRPTSGISLQMTLDAEQARYQYDCASGTCEGFAADVWRAMPESQQETYLSVLADHIAPGITTNRPWLLIEIVHNEQMPLRPGQLPQQQRVGLSAIRFETGSGAKTYRANYLLQATGENDGWLQHLP